MSSSPSILIVDDEAAIREMISTGLKLAGINCLTAKDATEAHRIIFDHAPDLILLDWMLPTISGIDFARRLRKEEISEEIPIIMLTARTDEDYKVQGLDAGVDDYMTKPFSMRELIARVKAILRRKTGHASKKNLQAECLVIDPISQRVSVNQQIINMGPTEYRLLEFFMSHPDRAYSRVQLLDQVWGNTVYIEDRTVDVHIRRLRKALEEHGVDHFIQTVRGTGYRFSIK
jgi:two-component system phosphate regulon response regulator PhoB